MEKKLLREEIDEIINLQKEYELLFHNLGKLEYQKYLILEKSKSIVIKEEELGKKLIEKYGKGSINLELGIFSSNE